MRLSFAEGLGGTVWVLLRRMRLADAVSLIPDFDRWNHADKIKYFAWYLHTYRNKDHFSANDIRACFAELGIAAPASVNPFIGVMEKRSPKEVIKTAKGYKLERQLRTALDARYGNREAAVRPPAGVTQLVSKIADPQERAYAEEIVTCYKYRAFRAVIALAWNLAYGHILNLIVPDARKPSDNVRLREDQVLDAAHRAGIISDSIHRLMIEKFEFRNATLLSPSASVSKAVAEDFLKQLLRGVVLERS